MSAPLQQPLAITGPAAPGLPTGSATGATGSLGSGFPAAPVYVPPTLQTVRADELQLWNDVKGAISAVPFHFQSTLQIAGVPATDLHAFNNPFSTAIEAEVVSVLNRIRDTSWDRRGKWADYAFVRQSQRFPDVVLRTNDPRRKQIRMGIEIKGWYVLAKEGEASFRFKVTPAVCTDLDLIVVVPWAFSEVVSGTPMLFPPYIGPAGHLAKLRNWDWEYGTGSGREHPPGVRQVTISTVTTNYPEKRERISDIASHDGSHNFGRIVRLGGMDDFTNSINSTLLAGIPVSAWQRFLKTFAENPLDANIDNLIKTLKKERRADPRVINYSTDQAEQLRELFELLRQFFIDTETSTAP